jgi:hypothetical protein
VPKALKIHALELVRIIFSCLCRKEYIPNKRLNEIFKYELNQLMKRKIQKVKSTLNFKCPEFFINSKKHQLTNTFANSKKSN